MITVQKEKVRKQKQKATKARIAKFLEEEAELGSDNEEHDDVRKKIRSDEDEDEGSNSDSDLSGFVDNAPLGDEDEIAEANAALREKYLLEADRLDEEVEA